MLYFLTETVPNDLKDPELWQTRSLWIIVQGNINGEEPQLLVTCVDRRVSRALLARAFLSTSFSSSRLGGSKDLEGMETNSRENLDVGKSCSPLCKSRRWVWADVNSDRKDSTPMNSAVKRSLWWEKQPLQGEKQWENYKGAKLPLEAVSGTNSDRRPLWGGTTLTGTKMKNSSSHAH